MKDGPFVTSDKIRELVNTLDMVLKVIVEGTLKADRENKDELT